MRIIVAVDVLLDKVKKCFLPLFITFKTYIEFLDLLVEQLLKCNNLSFTNATLFTVTYKTRRYSRI